MLRGLDLREAYLVPRVSWVGRDLSVEGFFTRTAAQYFSWHFSSGIAREHLPAAPNGDPSSARWTFVGEVGATFRVRPSGKRRVLALGYEFAELRLGVRSSGFDTLRPIRLVAELGAGVW